MKYPLMFAVLIVFVMSAEGQLTVNTDKMKKGHPRVQTDESQRTRLVREIQSPGSARDEFEKLKSGIDAYVIRHQTDPKWIVSRLQMYWKTKSTDVFIKAGLYDHASGEAPVPTVRFPGARDHVTHYAAPKFEDLLPYSDDPRGVLLINKAKPGQPLEWVEISKTGRQIEGINTNIMRLASTASLVYWISRDKKYAEFAFDLFDQYMMGMYYRNAPQDLSHGHHQTIAGLSTFEVIQEVAMLNNLTLCYDYLYNYIQRETPTKISLYEETFKKWADIQIKNGVAFNNWNLMQARNIFSIGLILEGNKQYADGKGNQFYFDQVLNKNSERQWALTKLLNEGYDPITGLWYESPGYSTGVLNDFTGFVNLFDRHLNFDIMDQMGLLKKAILAPAQYLFPNGYSSSFGDSHYHKINANTARDLALNAQLHGKKQEELVLTKFIKTLEAFNSGFADAHAQAAAKTSKSENGLQLSANQVFYPDAQVKPGDIRDFATPTIYSEKVSYFAQRNGFDEQNGLMVAMAGSKGNHMHANGISMEIYGKGIVLGPESGVGTSYFQQDYAEYYSQFPAHNTVAVDGISAYPIMKSNQGFQLRSSYPVSQQSSGYFPAVTFGDLNFLEPETQSDQNRMTTIIRTSDSTGYYVDVFRSKRRDGKDKMHDYFYHNLGQELVLKDVKGTKLDLKPTSALSFSGGHLFAYDYFWDKKSIVTAQDFDASFRLSVPGRDDVFMNLWMKGAADREIFSVKAPPSKAFRGNVMIPDSIAALPMPTLVVRQSGNAWNKPFVAVFEPSTAQAPKSIQQINSFMSETLQPDFVGLIVESKGDIKDHIFSSSHPALVNEQDIRFSGTLGIVRTLKDQPSFLFLGNGTLISKAGYSLKAETITSAAINIGTGECMFTSDQPITLLMPDTFPKGREVHARLQRNNREKITGKRMLQNGKKVVSFNLPQSEYSALILSY